MRKVMAVQEGNTMYAQFPNYKNIEDSCNLEGYVETYAH